jgi:hypothetical protein
MGKIYGLVGGTLLLGAFLTFHFETVAKANGERIEMNPGCAELVRSFSELVEPRPESSDKKRPPSPNASPNELVEMDLSQVQLALDGLDKLYEAIWGKNYVRETLHGNLDGLSLEVRSVLSLYYLAGEGRIPREVLLGIEERYQRQNNRIEQLKGKIAALRRKLGPSVEYLTPSTLAALDIFKEIGRSRNLIGGGVREALRTTAATVKTNLDSMMMGISCAGVFDSALRDLLVFVAQLVNENKLNPSRDNRIKEACEDLVITNFMASTTSLIPPAALSEKTLIAFRNFSRQDKSSLAEADRRKFSLLLNRVFEWQQRLQIQVSTFARTYYRSRIAWNTLSIMTRPNGYFGIPLGSALRDTMASLSDHPDTLRLALRAYGNKQEHLSLGIGDLIDSPTGPHEMLKNRDMSGVDRLLSPYLTTDARLSGLFSVGYEHELVEAEQLLRLSRRSKFWGFLSWGTGQITGGITRNFLNHSELVKQIAPGKFIDALVLQLEGTGSDPKAAANQPDHRRKVEILPRNLPTYLVDGTWLTPWNPEAKKVIPPAPNRAPVPATEPEDDSAEAPDLVPGEEKKETAQVPLDRDGDLLLTDDEPDQTPTQTRPPRKRRSRRKLQEQGASQPPLIEGDTKGTEAVNEGEVDNYLWLILDKLEARARSLLEEDKRIQTSSETASIPVDQPAIRLLAAQVEELLSATRKVLTSIESCFRAGTVRTENAEETFAWHLLKRAPTLAMYAVIGPPRPPNVNPPIVPGLAGLSWRIVMLAPRLAYGDGSVEEEVFRGDGGPEDPESALYRHRHQIATALVGAVVAIGGTQVVQLALHRLGVTAPTTSSAPEETKKKDAPRAHRPAPESRGGEVPEPTP